MPQQPTLPSWSSPPASQQPSRDLGEALGGGQRVVTPKPVKTSAREPSGSGITHVQSLNLSNPAVSRMGSSLSQSSISGTITGSRPTPSQETHEAHETRRSSTSSIEFLAEVDRQTDPNSRNNLGGKRPRESELTNPPAKSSKTTSDRPKYCKLFLDTGNLPNVSFASLITMLETNRFFQKAISVYPSADRSGIIITFFDSITAHKFQEVGFENELNNCIIRETRRPQKYTDYLIHNVPLEITITDIKQALEKATNDIVQNVYRLTRRSSPNSSFITRTVRVTVPARQADFFKCTHISLFGVNRYKVTTPKERLKITQCTKCWEIGHTSRQCQAPITQCKNCAGPHDYRECTRNEPQYYKCIGCHLPHKATFSKCPIIMEARDRLHNRHRNLSAPSSTGLQLFQSRHWPSGPSLSQREDEYQSLVLTTEPSRENSRNKVGLTRQNAVNSALLHQQQQVPAEEEISASQISHPPAPRRGRSYAHAVQGQSDGNRYRVTHTQESRSANRQRGTHNFIPPPASQIWPSVSATTADIISPQQPQLSQRERRVSWRSARASTQRNLTHELQQWAEKFKLFAANNPPHIELLNFLVLLNSLCNDIIAMLRPTSDDPIPIGLHS